MPSLREMRIEARKLGVRNSRELSTDELKDAIAKAKNGSKSKSVAKKAVAKASPVKRGPGRPRKAEVEEEAPRRRGRPPGSKSAPAKTAKRQASGRGPGRPKSTNSTTKKSTAKRGVGRPVGTGTGTRNMIAERINWNANFDFREGSSSQYILTALRKAAKKYKDTMSVREEAFDNLVDKLGKVDELTFMNRSTGKPWKGAEAENQLRTRIHRTVFDFVMNTGQHDSAGDGSSVIRSGNGNGKSKKSSSKTTAVKRGPGRPRKAEVEEEPTPKRRGRPPGSGKRTAASKSTPAKASNSKGTWKPGSRGRPPAWYVAEQAAKAKKKTTSRR